MCKLVCSIFLDVAKAYDCVDRKILADKLNQMGIRGNALNLFTSYINNRKQMVQINDTLKIINEDNL